MNRIHLTRGLVLLAIVLLVSSVASAQGARPVHHPGGLAFDDGGDHAGAVLTISGPDGIHFAETFGPGESPALGVADEWGNNLPDGQYTWELVTTPRISQELRDEMSGVADDPGARDELGSRLPRSERQGGSFRVLGGAIVAPDRPEPATRAAAPADQGPIGNTSEGVVRVTQGDQQILDDLIVDGSACVGQDCVNGESFGFDTIRIKENNLRIRAVDTSSSASFPTFDWQLTFNDSSNGGQNKFAVECLDGGTTPFTVEGCAPSHSLYVDDGGRIGFGTNNPVVDLHVKSGNTPTLRLEQDGSNGFTSQTWDLAGNETNLFIRDASNGSTLPFRIRPGAPTSAIDVDSNGDIRFGGTGGTDSILTAGDLLGIGTNSPDVAAHFVSGTGATGSDTLMRAESSTGSAAMQLASAAGNSATWTLFSNTTDGSLRFFHVGDANTRFELEASGALSIDGDLTASGVVTPSSRLLKDITAAVDGREVLAQLVNMPLAQWSYKTDSAGQQHMGPMAEDFWAAFGLGKNNRSIDIRDKAGVALAAIQGLFSEIQDKDETIEALSSRLEALEAMVSQLAAAGN